MNDDLISRQAAMDEMSKQQTYKMFVGEDTVYLDANDVGSVLASLPSIDAVPVKHGVWVTYTDGRMHCSNCSKIPINRVYALSMIVYDVDIGSMMKYCPNCGAIMDGE